MTAAGRTWAGTYAFRAPALVEATSIDDVRRVMAAGGSVRALGTRHSFTDLADTPGTLVTVTGIPADPVIDETAGTVTVGAGARYGQLAAWLQDRGWALHNTGSLPHISIGGATATGTHGSGSGNPVLSAAVRALEYVDAAGELVTVRRGDEDFDGLAVGLGAYGIVMRLTLDVQPSYRVRQDVFAGLRWDTLLDDVDGVMQDAYSVSVFTDWQGDELGGVWLKTRLADGDDAVPAVADEWRGAARRRGIRPVFARGDTSNLTVQGGVAGPWSERLPHFRNDRVASNGDEIQSEYFVPRAQGAEALDAVRRLRDRITPLLLISELRTVAPDGLWLSGAYRRHALCIHFTWRNVPGPVLDVLPLIEQALEPFDPRPHWGKLHAMSARQVERAFPRLPDARRLFSRLDPRGRFSGPHLSRLGITTV